VNGIEQPIAELKSEKAKKLADYAAILLDLKFCIACSDRTIEVLQAKSEDVVLLRAMWTAALVSYARCFATGVRYGLTPSIFDQFEGEPQAAHEYYLQLRNKHIAHSVNPFEQVVVGAVLSPRDAQERSVEGVATLLGSNISDSAESVAQLRTLARAVGKHVNTLREELQAEVLEETKAVPIDDLYNRVNPRVTVPPSSAASSPR
jgi:hypothetical protein